jgi:hypothetical protein
MSAVGRLCCKSRLLLMGRGPFRYERAGFDPPALTPLSATPTLRAARSPSGWWPRNQQCEPSPILNDGGQNKLVLGASWATKSKPIESQDAPQVCKSPSQSYRHLNLLEGRDHDADACKILTGPGPPRNFPAQGFVFRRRLNDGNSGCRCAPPAVRETPDFEGLFRCRKSVAGHARR